MDDHNIFYKTASWKSTAIRLVSVKEEDKHNLHANVLG